MSNIFAYILIGSGIMFAVFGSDINKELDKYNPINRVPINNGLLNSGSLINENCKIPTDLDSLKQLKNCENPKIRNEMKTELSNTWDFVKNYNYKDDYSNIINASQSVNANKSLDENVDNIIKKTGINNYLTENQKDKINQSYLFLKQYSNSEIMAINNAKFCISNTNKIIKKTCDESYNSDFSFEGNIYYIYSNVKDIFLNKE